MSIKPNPWSQSENLWGLNYTLTEEKDTRPREIVWRYPQSIPLELIPKKDGLWGRCCTEVWSVSVLNLNQLLLALSALLHSYSQLNHTAEAAPCNEHCVELPWYTKIKIKFPLLALRWAMISKGHLSNVQLMMHHAPDTMMERVRAPWDAGVPAPSYLNILSIKVLLHQNSSKTTRHRNVMSYIGKHTNIALEILFM